MAETVMGTFLFTDLVASTAMSSALRTDAADELRQEHFGLLRGPVSSTGGTEVKNLGDGLMVVFLSPSRAAACAVTMQQAVERHNRRNGSNLAIRIGIATGEASFDEDDYFGEPVIAAARLCGLANGGQILATDIVRSSSAVTRPPNSDPLATSNSRGCPSRSRPLK